MSAEQDPAKKRAIALRHEKGERNVPEVVASGRGEIAERILECARAHNVPIHRDPDLVHVLAHLDVGDEIPPEIYRVVAEVLVFIYTMNGRYEN